MLCAVNTQNEVVGPLAEELVAKCPAKVFDIEDLAGRCCMIGIYTDSTCSRLFILTRLICAVCCGLGGGKRAVVARPRNCTMCRECIREPEWEQRVELRRIRDHFICECTLPSIQTSLRCTQQLDVRLLNVLI